MASTHAKNAAPAGGSSTDVPLPSSFLPAAANGTPGEAGISVTMTKQEWLGVVGGLTVAGAQAATQRNYAQMIEWNALCAALSKGLGIASITATDLPPPLLTRSATA